MKQVSTIIFLFILFSNTAFAQGLIQPELPSVDSVLVKDSLLFPENSLTNQLLFLELALPLFDYDPVEFPKFDFNEGFLNMQQDYNYYVFNPQGINNMNFPFAAMPLIHSSAIFSQAAYKLSDKFTIGGNSFGANSIYSSPLPNKGLNNFDVRGASMFLQYKVSNKVKIQTRISVTNRQF
ncbi:MAG: hypothetical protein HQ541_19895 [Mariniphaga sp.]|nr:hypothetical protein [Mariniphaga sp.]